MAFTFTEDVTLKVPDVPSERLENVSESFRTTAGNVIVVEIAAIHRGLTQNYTHYSAEELRRAVRTWVDPYPRSVIKNHDVTTEPLGRVIASKMDKEEDGTEFIMIQAMITDFEAVTKVMDGRYLTGSIGGKSEHALCSICKADWATSNGRACAHERGKIYSGELCYLDMKGISFREYSIVNTPADERSTIRTVHSDATREPTGDEWHRAARVFAVDRSAQRVVEFAESADIDVLAGSTAEEAHSVFSSLQISFLSTLSEMSVKEFDVSTEKHEEDLLGIAEGLSQDLATMSEESEDAPETPPSEDDPEPESAEGESEEDTEPSTDSEPATEDDAEEPVVAAESETEVEPETEDEPEAETEADTETEAEAADEESDDSEAAEDDSTAALADLESRIAGLESQNADLVAQIDALTASNAAMAENETRMKALLKQQLAESVVDMKIAKGFEKEEKRGELVTEHLSRSASSLADARRDLAAMPKVTSSVLDSPKVEEMLAPAGAAEESQVIEEDGGTFTESTAKKDPVEYVEDRLVNALLGKFSLQ